MGFLWPVRIWLRGRRFFAFTATTILSRSSDTSFDGIAVEKHGFITHSRLGAREKKAAGDLGTN